MIPLLLILATIRWTAPGDDSTSGTATRYEMRYSTTAPAYMQAWWDSATVVTGLPAPLEAGTQQEMTVPLPIGVYYFVMRTGDEVPNWSEFSNLATVLQTEEVPVDSMPPREIADLHMGDTSIQIDGTYDWWPLIFGAPEPRLRYYAYIVDHQDKRWDWPVFSQPIASASNIGNGGTDTVWARLSRNGLPRHLRLVAADTVGWLSGPSNSVVFMLQVRDTFYADVSNGGMTWTKSRETRPGVRVSDFTRAPGDSGWFDSRALPRIASQEEIQRLDKPTLCGTFADSLGPYWCLRGTRMRDCEGNPAWFRVKPSPWWGR